MDDDVLDEYKLMYVSIDLLPRLHPSLHACCWHWKKFILKLVKTRGRQNTLKNWKHLLKNKYCMYISGEMLRRRPHASSCVNWLLQTCILRAVLRWQSVFGSFIFIVLHILPLQYARTAQCLTLLYCIPLSNELETNKKGPLSVALSQKTSHLSLFHLYANSNCYRDTASKK